MRHRHSICRRQLQVHFVADQDLLNGGLHVALSLAPAVLVSVLGDLSVPFSCARLRSTISFGVTMQLDNPTDYGIQWPWGQVLVLQGFIYKESLSYM